MSLTFNRSFLLSKEVLISFLAVIGILVHITLRFLVKTDPFTYNFSLYVVLFIGGAPLVLTLLRKMLKGVFSSDLLAGISIVVALLLDEALAGSIVVLMLSGGEALESLAVKRASDVLTALAKRMPTTAHKKSDSIIDVPVDDVRVGDHLIVYPHEICPVDGVVLEGRGSMDESFLTGEPYRIEKTPGAQVISGSINGNSVLTIQASKKAIDSRHAKIIEVMRRAENERPRIRRLGDTLGAYYTPFALMVAIAAAYFSGDITRFLAVLVVATPCPLLIAIPITIISSISLAAKHSIIIKDPSALEQVDKCTTIILDKTGTLTYGEPVLTKQIVIDGIKPEELLLLVASIEQYSKHPLAKAIILESNKTNTKLVYASSVSEPPGRGLTGYIKDQKIEITNRKNALRIDPSSTPPIIDSGLECCILLNDKYVATYVFHDSPRDDSRDFIKHLRPKHQFDKIMLVSGDRESEVKYLAEIVGIDEVYHSQTPEQKVEIVKREEAKSKTIFIGDGINDAPALTLATVGIAFGQNSEITSEAAGVIIMEPTLKKVDEFFHISRRMRQIATQSAVGGMILSIIGMGFASAGMLPPVSGAIVQELIDIFAILNALRAGITTKKISDLA